LNVIEKVIKWLKLTYMCCQITTEINGKHTDLLSVYKYFRCLLTRSSETPGSGAWITGVSKFPSPCLKISKIYLGCVFFSWLRQPRTCVPLALELLPSSVMAASNFGLRRFCSTCVLLLLPSLKFNDYNFNVIN